MLTWDENLALRLGTRIHVSAAVPHGGGARDPYVLLNETAHRLNRRDLASFDQARTYDTYDGQNVSDGPDWYQVDFPDEIAFNFIEMTMGFPYRDGGWWASLAVEVERRGRWEPVANLQFTPTYSFENSRALRKPFETYALSFDEVWARRVRLIGQPGGLAEFTSLARLAVYLRERSHWNPETLPETPIPHVFELIQPHIIWDLSDHLRKVTGLVINFPLVEYYLDPARYQTFWHQVEKDYRGEPGLWFLLGDALGWNIWNSGSLSTPVPTSDLSKQPHIGYNFHQVLMHAAAPIVVEDRVLGEMTTHPPILNPNIDQAQHRHYAQELNIPWSIYQRALDRPLHMTREQLDGVAGLMGMIANNVANLASRNLFLEGELQGRRPLSEQRASQRKAIVRRAIDFMQENLERPVGVAEVAAHVALSEPYFSTLFTEQTGRNPSDVLIDLRLERAKEYLMHTQMSVMDVCVTLDYSPSYFSRLFKHRVGCTPGEYARRRGKF